MLLLSDGPPYSNFFHKKITQTKLMKEFRVKELKFDIHSLLSQTRERMKIKTKFYGIMNSLENILFIQKYKFTYVQTIFRLH